MGENSAAHQLKDYLVQLKCHFTWGLEIENSEVPDLENRIREEIEFLDTKYNVGIHNLLAYVKHLQGQDEEALQSLKEAEDLIQRQHADLSDTRSLVTWGNYAWLYYHMDRLEEAQTYLDKVENTCQRLASMFRYRMECPEMDCAEGWALLKCGRQNYERARVCFEKALKVEPENPEFSTGYAITLYRLDYDINHVISLNALQQAVRLNPEDTYIKVLLGLKLQDVKREDEGEMYIEEALRSPTSLMYILRYAAKFYRRKGCVEKALPLLERALQKTPTSAFLHHQIGLCYRAQVFQINEATHNWAQGKDKEKMNMIRLAIFHFKSALEQRPTFDIALLHLAHMYVAAKNYRRAEESFQTFFLAKPQEEKVLQEGHFYYARFLEFQKKSEVDAIRHYLNAIEVKCTYPARDKSILSLEKLALRKLRRDQFDLEGLSLLGLVYKLKGEIHVALEYYERALSLSAACDKAVKHRPQMI